MKAVQSRSVFPLHYYGHKAALLREILSLVPPDAQTFLDPFCGTGIVAWTAKRLGMRVVVNDVLLSAHLRHRALIANNHILLDENDHCLLTGNRAAQGHFHARYLASLGKRNAEFLDTLTQSIPQLSGQFKQDIATIVPCLVAMENLKFDCIRFTPSGAFTGGQNLRAVDIEAEFAKFVRHRLPLLVCDNKQDNEAHQQDALRLIESVMADVLYVDTPYVCRAGSYEGMYSCWDDWCRLLQGRHGEIINSYDGKADLAPYARFDRRTSAILGFMRLFKQAAHIPTVIVSYNTTSGIAPVELEEIARSFGRTVTTKKIPYPLPTISKTKPRFTDEVLIKAVSTRPTIINFSNAMLESQPDITSDAQAA